MATVPMRAVHRFFEVDLAVAVGVELGCSARRRPSSGFGAGDFALLRDRRPACRLCGNRLASDRSTLKASSGLTSPRLVGIDAPQVADAFAVLGVFADGDVDQAVVDHRRGDDVVAGAAAAERSHFDVLGIASNFQSSLALPLPSPCGVEAVEPAVAAAEDHLRHAAEHGVGRATTIGRAGCSVPGELSVHSTLPVFLSSARKLGASGAGMLMCDSSTPLDVLTNRMSPAAVTEQLHMLCCEMPSSFIMSNTQIDVGFVLGFDGLRR